MLRHVQRVPLFAKMMDYMAVDLMNDDRLGVMIGGTKIPALLYVDDGAPPS